MQTSLNFFWCVEKCTPSLPTCKSLCVWCAILPLCWSNHDRLAYYWLIELLNFMIYNLFYDIETDNWNILFFSYFPAVDNSPMGFDMTSPHLANVSLKSELDALETPDTSMESASEVKEKVNSVVVEEPKVAEDPSTTSMSKSMAYRYAGLPRCFCSHFDSCSVFRIVLRVYHSAILKSEERHFVVPIAPCLSILVIFKRNNPSLPKQLSWKLVATLNFIVFFKAASSTLFLGFDCWQPWFLFFMYCPCLWTLCLSDLFISWTKTYTFYLTDRKHGVLKYIQCL